MGFPLLHYNSKTIELNGAELQKLRVNLQKLQLQNWNLAQSNSHISAVGLVFFLIFICQSHIQNYLILSDNDHFIADSAGT